MNISQVILSNLIFKIDYTRKVIPFLKSEYFPDIVERSVFETMQEFFQKHNSLPSKNVLSVEIQKKTNFSQDQFDAANEMISAFAPPQEDIDWLVSETEKFCKDKALHNAIFQSIEIMSGKDKKNPLSTNAIPDLLKEALSVSFETNIGHDYIDDCNSRYDYYHRKEETILFDIDLMNKITNNGIPKKTLCVVCGETGSGKSIFLCHHAANCIRQGLNVLYITLEMSEERLAERIDANLMNITLGELKNLEKNLYDKKMDRVKQTVKGKLIIKEYPTSSANVLHFKHLINELRMKKKFVPDVILVDYINICASARYKPSSQINSYTMVKAIAEELRGMAVECNAQVFSATQLNRKSYSATDVGIEDIAESMGLAHTSDFIFSLVCSEELEELGQVMFKQLKNRFNDVSYYKKFCVGLDKSKMKFYNLDEKAQTSLVNVNSTNGKVSSPSNTNKPQALSFENNKETSDEQEDAPFVPTPSTSGGGGAKRPKFSAWT